MKRINLLSIAPYRILPPTSGGHLGIASLHHYLGLICNDHIISTDDNVTDPAYSFRLHSFFPSAIKRYIPFYKFSSLVLFARENNIQAIYCDHPYMAPTALALSRKIKVPWFIRSHNIESERFRTYGKKWWPLMRIFEGSMLRKATGVFLITPEDIKWAQENYRLKPEKCHLIPYGTILDKPPEGHKEAKSKVAGQLGLDEKIPWLYFLGAMDFYPNTHALTFILDEIMPRLKQSNLNCQVLIAGKGLNEELKERISNTTGIKYTGFIPDLNDFLKACDIMLNPVILGGGIKTKAVEALGYDKIVVSTVSGAAGLLPEYCGANLLIATDGDWDTFTNHILAAIHQRAEIPATFYDLYYWGNIARKILSVIEKNLK